MFKIVKFKSKKLNINKKVLKIGIYVDQKIDP